MPLFEQAQHAFARRRRIVVRHDWLVRNVFHRDLLSLRQRVRRRKQQDELVAADNHLEEAALRRAECQRPEVETPLLHLDGDLSRGHTPDVHGDVGHLQSELRHQRQERVHGRFVGADEHAAAAQVAQLAHGRLGLFRQTHEPLTVVLQHASSVRQRAALRRTVEQLLAQIGFEPADRLADRGLRSMHFGRGAGEAPLLRDGQKDAQGHEVHISSDYFTVIIITLTSTTPGRYN